ncbi:MULTISPECIES: glycosyltransferase [unclassified Mesorhizobium]|uniref:glycosyltransferase family 2 protein n=1 Tax=unclassified Mesorhizobium TaxID=325217 RepID=UPI0011262016|nr:MULTISPECIES: glycosyltransferase [unclassified Mesorhizobium]MBZ9985014.1 glycosyltransferase [Mesorhizobium sp. BR-1-1-8]TPL27486.1 glycosyltransferase [Mesorhizobium sp. B2-4-8]TPL59376.1 glycosyltransferase [Mesorhizobium sp. B2-4-1]
MKKLLLSEEQMSSGRNLAQRAECTFERTVNEPTVSVTVLIVTYNHARYVAAAIDSVLMQDTESGVEILISEDFSTDGTREIVERYVSDYPERLSAIYSGSNLRSNEVVARGLRVARGRYVSILDGDDLWTSKTKLRDQVAHLDAHPELSAIFYNALVAHGDEITSRRWTPRDQKPLITQREIWEGNPFATCGSMMRTACVRDVPSWYADFFPITDWPLYVHCAKTADLAFVDEVAGIYRLHPGGLVSALPSPLRLDAIEGFYRRMANVMDARGAQFARGGCSRYFYEWSKQYLNGGDLPSARSCFLRLLRSGTGGNNVPKRDIARLALLLLKSSVLGR